jgi:chromate reductase, NAD(P)H dehydrogenase (quinone)
MSKATLLGLCGSLRADSYNRKLMQEAARRWNGAFIEGSLRLPLYDGDLEARGIPPEVTGLAGQVASADALLIACPEYNKGPPGVVKNALDWLSRVKPNPLFGKRVAIVSAAAGRAGGERAQVMLRSMLVPHRVQALTWPEVLVGGSEREFDADGRLVAESYRTALDTLISRLADTSEG